MLVFVLQLLSLYCEILIMLFSHHIAYNYYHADWNSLPDNLGDVPWKNIFKHSDFAATSEFCE